MMRSWQMMHMHRDFLDETVPSDFGSLRVTRLASGVFSQSPLY
jgi:hypothetical protein